jgi:hypothetical protein
MFFETPTQVKFWDPDGGHYTAGIAYKDEIICGCCGSVFEIEEIIEDTKNDGVVPIIPYELWVDLVSEIAGDDL